MERRRPRITLDDPELNSRLRQYHRSSAFVHRPVGEYTSRVISDVTPFHQPRRLTPKAATSSRPRNSLPHKPRTEPEPVKPATKRSWLKLPKLPKILITKPALLYGMAGFLFLAGLGVAVNGWRSNDQVAAQVQHLQSQSNTPAGTPSPNTPVVPSSQPVTEAVRRSYAVAPDLPRYLIIPKIRVHARVMQTGVTASGALGTPKNIYDTAWYTGSAKPGEPGATLIDGHLTGYNATGIFWNLHKLSPGDAIQIQRGDGQIINYKVVKSQSFASDKVDMQSALLPVTSGKPGLNLITCEGEVGKNTDWNYSQRLIVYAEQV